METPTNNDEEYRKTFPNRALEATERPASLPSRFAPEGEALVYPFNGKLLVPTAERRRVAKKGTFLLLPGMRSGLAALTAH